MAIDILLIICGLSAILTVFLKNTKVQLFCFIISQYMLCGLLFLNEYHFLCVGYAFMMTGALLVMVLANMVDFKEYLRFGKKWKRYVYGLLCSTLVILQTMILGVVFWKDGLLDVKQEDMSIQVIDMYKALFSEYYLALGTMALLLISVTYTLIVVRRSIRE